MVKEELKKIEILEKRYKENWGKDVDYTIIPREITQEKLVSMLERIAATGEGLLVDMKKSRINGSAEMYGLKMFFKYRVNNEEFYEERIIRVKAESFDEAYNKAWEYAKSTIDEEHINPDGDRVYETIIDIVDCFLIYEDSDAEEVYSSIKKRPQNMTEKEYIDFLSKSCSKEELKVIRYR
ncbi:MAG: DUF4288 domain-containing protein [Firmicutes bacterium]|nr:DUF4288 domain-containing protein [Bacillota bacterium]